MTDFREVRLGDVTTGFDHLRQPIRASDREAGQYPYYGASGVIDHVSSFLFDGEYLLVAEDGENLRTRKTSIAFMATGRFWVNNHAHVIKGNEQANSRFLAYLFATIDISGYLSGSTQPKLTQQSLRGIRISIPPTREQDGIAAVLGALDDKIEVNDRIAITSEEICILLATCHPGATSSPVREICDLKRSTVLPQEMATPRVAHFSLPAYDSKRQSVLESPKEIKSGKFMISKPSTLFSKLNPETPRVWNVCPDPNIPALASTEFLVLEPSAGITHHEVWAVMSDPKFHQRVAARVTGTSRSHQRVRPTEIMSESVCDPRTLGPARPRINALAERARSARSESQTLAELRDTLLPELMSGRLRVRDAEHLVEDAT